MNEKILFDFDEVAAIKTRRPFLVKIIGYRRDDHDDTYTVDDGKQIYEVSYKRLSKYDNAKRWAEYVQRENKKLKQK
jgi:hypothetical protein